MAMTCRARADVVTDSPARYAKQLVSHLGRREPFKTEHGTSTRAFGEGRGTIVIGAGVLTLIAEGPDEEALARVQGSLSRHLERFGRRNELQVTWVPDPR
jgi:hypothetical protein